MEPEAKLDAVLRAVKEIKQEEKIRFTNIKSMLMVSKVDVGFFSREGKDIDDNELQLLLDKLVEDKYLSKQEKENRYSTTFYYKLNFNGKSFIDNGGYTRQKLNLQSEKRNSLITKVSVVVNAILVLYIGFRQVQVADKTNSLEEELKQKEDQITDLNVKHNEASTEEDAYIKELQLQNEDLKKKLLEVTAPAK